MIAITKFPTVIFHFSSHYFMGMLQRGSAAKNDQETIIYHHLRVQETLKLNYKLIFYEQIVLSPFFWYARLSSGVSPKRSAEKFSYQENLLIFYLNENLL